MAKGPKNRDFVEKSTVLLYFSLVKLKVYVLVMVVLLCCISSRFTYANDIKPRPSLNWKVGDSWKVRTWNPTLAYITGKDTSESQRKANAVDVSFEVKRIISMNDFKPPYLPKIISQRNKAKERLKKNNYKCFEVQVTYPKNRGFQRRYLLFFRKGSMNLIRVQENSIRTDGSVMNYRDDYPIDPNEPIFATSEPGIPFDWPNFEKEKVVVEKKTKKGKRGDTRIFNQDIKKKTFKDSQGKSIDGYEVIMKKISKNENTERELVKSTQKWKKDAKWWSQSIYNYRGTQWSGWTTEAELIED